MARLEGRKTVCKETIYQYIYAEAKAGGVLWKQLPRANQTGRGSGICREEARSAYALRDSGGTGDGAWRVTGKRLNKYFFKKTPLVFQYC